MDENGSVNDDENGRVNDNDCVDDDVELELKTIMSVT